MADQERKYRPIVLSQHKAIEDVISVCEEKAMDEREGYGWGAMTRGVLEYETSFAPVLPRSIADIVSERAAAGESTAILDFMSFGVFLYDASEKKIPFSHGISVSLDHWMTKNSLHTSPAVSHVTGNILQEETWRRLDEEMERYMIARFGLITWAAAGGVDASYITSSAKVYNEILQRLWSRLAKSNGTLLVEIPRHIVLGHEAGFRTWHDSLMRITGRYKLTDRQLVAYHQHFSESVMRLEKTPLLSKLPHLE